MKKRWIFGSVVIVLGVCSLFIEIPNVLLLFAIVSPVLLWWRSESALHLQRNKQQKEPFNKEVAPALAAQAIDREKDQKDFRREFIGNISHELNTPIFNIQGYLLTLLDGALEDPKLSVKYLKRSMSNVNRMVHIVQDLGEISKLESQKVELNLEFWDLKDLVENAIETLESFAKETEMDISYNNQGNKRITVYCDGSKIIQVFVNLFENAIKYNTHAIPTIRVSAEVERDVVSVSIRDNGIGIPQEDLPRIFERFYRVDKSRSTGKGGSGLGLAIAKHVLDAHGQAISVVSTKEKGTTFSFTLNSAS